MFTNKEIKRTADQLFAFTLAYQTPFSNRVRSRKEIIEGFGGIFREDSMELITEINPDLYGSAYILSAPLGTGKSFLVEVLSNRLGIDARPIIPGYCNREVLDKIESDVVYFDELDIKTMWESINQAMMEIGEFLRKRNKIALLVGDYSLRNRSLLEYLPNYQYVEQFEFVDRDFIELVLNDRMKEYLKQEYDGLMIEQDLMQLITAPELVRVNSFRDILAFLSTLSGRLPFNGKECRFTMEMAHEWLDEEYDAGIVSDEQEEFLDRIIDKIENEYPQCVGLQDGFGREELFHLMNHKFSDIESFSNELLYPMAATGILYSAGIPKVDENGEFVRRPEPYYPSIPLRLWTEM